MQPFERLRYLARWSDEYDSALVSEAADCLAGFADDPAGLVVACRRLVSHHPVSGALWWLCARVLTASDPAEAAWEAWQLVNEDGTTDRLSRLLPFPHDEPIAVLGWPDLAGAALAERPDLDVIAIRRRSGDDHRRARLARRDAAIRIVSEVDAAALEPSHLLVEARAASPTSAVVPDGAADLLDTLAATGTVGWLVAGVCASCQAAVRAHAGRARAQASRARRSSSWTSPPLQAHRRTPRARRPGALRRWVDAPSRRVLRLS